MADGLKGRDVGNEGLLEQTNHRLITAIRKRRGRASSPSAPIIDNQSIKIDESGGSRDYDACKTVKAASDPPSSLMTDARFVAVAENVLGLISKKWH